jgi:hypothetical protein
MSKQHFLAQSTVPGWSILLLVLAAACVAFGVSTSDHEWYYAALLPAALAICFWSASGNYTLELTDEGIEISDPPRTIRYDDIYAVRSGSKARPLSDTNPRRALRLLTPDGWIRLAGNFAPATRDLIRSILERIPRGGSRQVPRELQEFLHEQLTTFDEDRVWSFKSVKRPRIHAWRAAAAGLAFIVVGIVWIVQQIGQHRDPTTLGIFGGLFVVVGIFTLLIGLLVDQSAHTGTSKKLGLCGLVISPKAIAMKQGQLAGTLRWDEIRDVRFGKGRGIPGAIYLHLDGALLNVLDIYDRPIQQIHELIRQYWDRGARG